MRVTDLITAENINEWATGEVVTIEAGTGKGKSFFIKNVLYEHAKANNKKILMLIHRLNCINQFQLELEEDDKLDIIDLKTYQYIDSRNSNVNKIDFSFKEYDYIICDEFHYFMSDASFNRFTDVSLAAILKQNEATKIFMSATGNYMKQYINNYMKIETIDYSIPVDFSFINRLEFFHSDDVLFEYVEDAIKYNKKAIFFIQSAKKAYELHKKYKNHTLFNCSKNNKKYYKYVDQDKINVMLKNERFDELILITTTVMDAGVNIIDSELKHIVCDVEDTGVLIQCIGRKRIIGEQDKIHLHVKTIHNQQLGGKETQINKKLQMADYFRLNGTNDFVTKYYRQHDSHGIVYDEVINSKNIKKLNMLMYFKLKIDLIEVDLIKSYGSFGYCNYIAKLFGFYDSIGGYDYMVYEETKSREGLNEYLDSVAGKKLFKDEQEKLKEVFIENGLRARTLGINTLNGNLKDSGLPYMILSKRSSERINGKPKSFTYWEVICDIDLPLD